MSAIKQHPFNPCTHPGQHGYGVHPIICDDCREVERRVWHVAPTSTVTYATVTLLVPVSPDHDPVAEWITRIPELADARVISVELPGVHTVRGEPIGPEGLPYGTTHDYDCPGCKDIPFTASPRSETYWSS